MPRSQTRVSFLVRILCLLSILGGYRADPAVGAASSSPCAPPYLRSVCSEDGATQDSCQLKRHSYNDAAFRSMLWQVGPTPAELEAEGDPEALKDLTLSRVKLVARMRESIDDWHDACRRLRPISQHWDALCGEPPPRTADVDTACTRCPEDTMYVDWVTVDVFQNSRLLNFELAAFVPRRDQFHRLVGGMIIVPELPKLPEGAPARREKRATHGDWHPTDTNLEKSTLDIGVVLSHEFGHSLGLGNTQYFQSLMFANAWARNRKTTPQACDCVSLNVIYGAP